MLPKTHLTSHSRMSGCRWVATPWWLLGSWRSFLYSSSVYSYHLFLISSASVRSIPFLSFIVPILAWIIPLISAVFLRRFLVFPFCYFSPFVCIVLFSLLFSGTLHSVGYIFPFLLCLSLLSFSQLFLRPPQTTTLSFCTSFSCGWFWYHLLYSVMNLHPEFFRHSCLPNLIAWIYSSPPLYNHKGFDLGNT